MPDVIRQIGTLSLRHGLLISFLGYLRRRDSTLGENESNAVDMVVNFAHINALRNSNDESDQSVLKVIVVVCARKMKATRLVYKTEDVFWMLA